MLRSALVSILIALVTSLTSSAQDVHPGEVQPSHYAVRFSAMIGELEPVAGEVLCARDRDCEILLAFVPEITIRLRPDRSDVRYGSARIVCADLPCALDLEEQEVPYGSKVNDIRIWTGQGERGVIVHPVWRPRRELGRFTFVIDRKPH